MEIIFFAVIYALYHVWALLTHKSRYERLLLDEDSCHSDYTEALHDELSSHKNLKRLIPVTIIVLFGAVYLGAFTDFRCINGECTLEPIQETQETQPIILNGTQ